MGEIGAPIQLGIGGRHRLGRIVLQMVDESRDNRQFGRQVEAVFQRGLPIILFSETIVIFLGKDRIGLHSQDGLRKHGHWQGIGRHGAQHFENILRHLTTGSPFVLDFQRFLERRDFSHQKQIVQASDQRDGCAFQQGRLGAFVGTFSGNFAVLGFNKASLSASDFNGPGDFVSIGNNSEQVWLVTKDADLVADATNDGWKAYYVYDSDATAAVSVKVELVATINTGDEFFLDGSDVIG